MLASLKVFWIARCKRVWVAMLLCGLGVGVELCFSPPPSAEANLSNFLVGGRRNQGGRSANRQKGGGVRAGRLNGGFDSRIPYVITPRNTFEASDQFTIRWQAVAGVETYTVRLWQWEDANGGRQQVVWQTTTSGTAVRYSGTPPLATEAFYAVEVITDQGVSSDLDAGCAIAGFAVLFPETRSRLQADLEAIDLTTLSPEEQALARAEVYLNYQMLDAAIATLAEQLALTPTDTLYLALGDFYSLAGLNTLARVHYTQALELATANRDDLWRAIALEGLGEVAVMGNDLAAALPYLRQAQLSYGLANVPLQANQVKDRIDLLETAQRLGIPPTDEPQVCVTAPLAPNPPLQP
ncbi:MAG TPA: tetratricopeptide repeat protein [Leptolyngbyaceae cyanobacterium M65_K2018_010]|nr:tetratricopeptide repeat protein [Leptolyngbyaceae cyanobacterium M65_K2018_010]